jgi:hypothetical protein
MLAWPSSRSLLAFPSLPFAPRTVLPSTAITSPAAGRCGPRPQPRPENRVEYVCADLGERAPAGRLAGRAAGRAQAGEHVGAGVGGPLADRGGRPRPGGHRRDPHGEQTGQRVAPAALLPLVRNLGQQTRMRLAAGSGNQRR